MEKKTGIKRAKKFNQCHRAKKLPELDPGDTIYIRDLKREAVVVEQHHSPRSYLVRTSQQTTPLRWNRRHLVTTPRESPRQQRGMKLQPFPETHQAQTGLTIIQADVVEPSGHQTGSTCN